MGRENLYQELKIKQRDRWTCRLCGIKFVLLTVYRFGAGTDDDSFISLCVECRSTVELDVGNYVSLFTSMLKRSKIILIGDVHGRFERLDEVLSAEEPFDFFISVGDVGTLGDVTPENITYIDKYKDRGFFVMGNHDDVQFFTPLGLMQEIGGITISGLNGIIKNKTFARDTKDISFREVLYLSHQKDVDILVTHQAPTGVFKDIGQPVLEELLNYLVPKLYVFGHVHKYKLKFHLRTFVISLPLITKGYAVAYFQGRELRDLEVIFRKGKRVVRV